MNSVPIESIATLYVLEVVDRMLNVLETTSVDAKQGKIRSFVEIKFELL